MAVNLSWRDVRLDGFTPNELPVKFEAGTPPIAEAIGLHAALDYLDAVGRWPMVALNANCTTPLLVPTGSERGVMLV